MRARPALPPRPLARSPAVRAPAAAPLGPPALTAGPPRRRSTPLSSIAQWLATLFGDADLTPSDLSAAIVLTMAAQHRRRRLRIRRALERSSAVQQSEAERGEASSSDQGGARLALIQS